MPHPDDELLFLRKRVLDLEKKVKKLSRTEICKDCGMEIPVGLGLGFSVPEEEWTDRTKSRPMSISPLCHRCTIERMFKKRA